MSDLTNPHVQLEVGVDVSGAKAGMQGLGQEADKLKKKLSEPLPQQSSDTPTVTNPIPDRTAEKVARQTGSIISQIQRLTAEIQSAGQSSKRIEILAGLRGLDTNGPEIKKALDGLKAAEAGMTNLGTSAKATSAAMRQVPAQFTDIVVSLQGGQNPLTVLLQQGGQLKDVFGSAGEAAKAMGSYIAGLVNPFSVLAVAAAAFGSAIYKGAQESSEFNKTLILTGNQAGVTAGQLMLMAQSIDSVAGTQGNAADVLNQLAATGKVTGSSLQGVASAIIQMERAGGPAAKEMVKAFAELGKDPLQASLKLNEQYGYLTAATYTQIKALVEQGKVTEAVTLAQNAFSDGFLGKAPEMEKQLGYLELAWRGVGDAVSKTWDKMKSIGRTESVETQNAAIGDTIAKLEKNIAARKAGGYDTQLLDAELAKLKERQSILQSDARLMKSAAETQAEQVQLTKKKAEWDKQGEAFQTKQEQMRKEVLRAETEGQVLVNAGLMTEKELRDRIQNIRNKFVESTGQDEVAQIKARTESLKQDLALMQQYGVGIETITEAEKKANTVREQIATVSMTSTAKAQKMRALAALEDQVAVERAITREKARMEMDKQIAVEQAKTVDAAYQSADAITKQAMAQEASNAVQGKGTVAVAEMTLQRKEERLELLKRLGLTGDYTAALEEEIAAQKRFVDALKDADYKNMNARTDELLRSAKEQQKIYQDELQLTGLTTLERNKLVALRQVEIKYAKELADLDKSSLSAEEKAVQRQKIEEAKRVESSAATGKVIQAEYERVANQIEQSLTDALMRGFESGKGFAQNLRDTVVNMFKTLVLKPVIQAVINPVAGAITGALGLAGTANAASAAGGSGLSGLMSGASALSGASSFGSGLASGLTAWGEGGSVMGLLEGGSSLFAGGTANGLGLIAGAAGPIIAGLAAIKMLAGSDTSGTMHTGGLAQYSAAGGLQTSTTHGAFGMGFGGVDYGKAGTDVAAGFAKGIATMLDSVAVTFGKKAGYNVATAFADDTSKDGAWGGLLIKNAAGQSVLNWNDTRTSKWAPKEFADGQAGAAQYAAAVAQDVAGVIKGMGLPEWAMRFANAIPATATLDELTAAMAQISAYPGQLLQQFGTSRDALVQQFTTGLMSGDAQAAGQTVADTLVASIEQAMVGNAAGQIFDIVNTGIVTPMLDAMLTGQALTQAATDELLQQTVDRAVAAASALSQVMASPAFTAALATIKTATASALGSAGAAYTYKPTYQLASATSAAAKAQEDAAAAAKAAAAAQEAYNSALRDAQSKLASAQQAVDSAYQSVLSVQGQATSNYLSALDDVASAQERVNDVLRQQYQTALDNAKALRDMGQSLRDFVAGETGSAQQAFQQVLSRALAGDQEAMRNLPQAATSANTLQQSTAATAADARLAQAKIMADVLRVAAMASSTPDPSAPNIPAALDDLAKAQADLAKSQSTLASSLAVANAIGAPLTQTVTSLVAQYQEAMGKLTASQADLAASQAALGAIATNTAATGTNTAATATSVGNVVLNTGVLTTIASNTDALQNGITASFDSNDPMRSVWEAIRVQTATSAFYLEDAGNKLNAIQYYLGESFRGSGSLQIRGATTAFAKGGVFTNSVVSSATPFNMGLMGEAGPEAIMPLRRGADGSLGVMAQMPNWGQYGRAEGMGAVVAEMRAMRASNEALRSDNQAQAQAMVQMQQELLRLHKRWESTGLPETRVVA